MIQKTYEITCANDECCEITRFYTNSIKEAEEVFKNSFGGIIIKGEHFCSKKCYERHRKFLTQKENLNEAI